ncbi:MAG TPA: metallophosphoesterase [Anaerolineae bacterium]|nr:metallophosphoesterase [Anaerolineae bacterium]HQK14365.1 metallophosphoesterase [Anaerolineae bacterium]
MTPSNFPPLSQIPSDRADGHSSWVHRALIFSGLLGRIQPLSLLPAWIALVAIAGWPWRSLQLPATLVSVFFLAVDWAMLALLPVRRRSWGPVTPSLLALTLVRVALLWIGAWLVPTTTGLALVAAIQALMSAAAIHATWIEPFRLTLTHIHYHPPHWKEAPPLRVLHISDLHFEGYSPREHALLAQVARLRPDLILLTGDYLNLSSVYDPAAQEGARNLLAQLHAPLGVYAVTGSPVVDVEGIVPGIFADLDIHWLNDQAVTIHHGDNTIRLLGVRTTYDIDRDTAALKRLTDPATDNAFTLLLYHTPDLMPVATEAGVHLYLCGHTHGGQIRLPLYGAVATSSRFGKRYEMGLYRNGACTLYVSRGLGMEGLGAPRARFLAPPEIGLWTFKPRSH